MLKFFVALLLIAEGMTESDICLEPPPCKYDDLVPKKFPETEEELKTLCQPAIDVMKCLIEFGEKCGDTESEVQTAYRAKATIEEVCSEDSLLHAAVVDNLECFGKLRGDESEFCHRQQTPDRIRQFAEALSEKGLVTLTDNESDDYTVHECINMMNFYACDSLAVERECGTVAMDVHVELLQKVGPGAGAGCENAYDLLPAVIRLLKLEEEKEHSIAEAFRKRK